MHNRQLTFWTYLIIVISLGLSILPVKVIGADKTQNNSLTARNRKIASSGNSDEDIKQLRSLNMINPIPELPFTSQDYIINPGDSPINEQTYEKPEFNRLVWSDEFNSGSVPDSSKWSYSVGTGEGGWGNSELQYYTERPENIVIRNGLLKIKAIREDFKGSKYTSAKLVSKNKFEFKYGRVEVSARLPKGAGTWPAIWMLGSNIDKTGWPGCGEIDIMEHRGSELNKIFATLHYPGRSGGNPDGGTTLISNATTAFHKYSLEWTSASIRILVDDQLCHCVANSETLPFNHNFFVILNLAMGGTFGGVADPQVKDASMEIDYIRVYQ